MMLPMGMTEVFVAQDGRGGSIGFDLGEQRPLGFKILGRRLDDEARAGHGVGEAVAGPHRLGGGGILAERGQVGADARPQCLQCLGHRVEHRDLVPMACENLRDAVAHEAGPDDGDSRLCGHALLLLRAAQVRPVPAGGRNRSGRVKPQRGVPASMR